MNNAQIFGMTYLLYRASYSAEKERNYREMVERLKGHIERWEESLSRLDNAKTRIETNIRQNEERLVRANERLTRLQSEASRSWRQRQAEIANTHPNPARSSEASNKVRDYDERVEKGLQQIERLRRWIEDGQSSLVSIRTKEWNLRNKIDDAQRRI